MRHIYQCTWLLIYNALVNRAPVEGLDLFLWPRLEEILDDIEEQRHSLPSKLSNDFFNVFSSVFVIVEQIEVVSFTTTYRSSIPF